MAGQVDNVIMGLFGEDAVPFPAPAPVSVPVPAPKVAPVSKSGRPMVLKGLELRGRGKGDKALAASVKALDDDTLGARVSDIRNDLHVFVAEQERRRRASYVRTPYTGPRRLVSVEERIVPGDLLQAEDGRRFAFGGYGDASWPMQEKAAANLGRPELAGHRVRYAYGSLAPVPPLPG